MSEEFETLEEVQAALDHEQALWDEMGLSMAGLQSGNPAPHILDMQARLQALVNVLADNGLVEVDELNFAYKVIILHNMRMLREQTPLIEQANLRRRILDGVNGNMHRTDKPPWER